MSEYSSGKARPDQRFDGFQAWARTLPGLVARLPLSVHWKLLGAFMAIVLLFILLGALGLQVLAQANNRTEELASIQKAVVSFTDLQTGINRERAAAAEALATTDAEARADALGRIGGSAYPFERMRTVAPAAGARITEVERLYSEFLDLMLRMSDALEAGDEAAAFEYQAQAQPIAADMERLTAGLVDSAESTVATKIAENEASFESSRNAFLAFAAGSIVLALLLGFAISWSVIRPVREMDQHLAALVQGDFTGRVDVRNADELGALADHLNRMTSELGRLYAELEAASRHKSEFLANMSHELRTPLNSIIGFSDALHERMFGELNEEQDEYIQDILTSGRHLLSLINDILDLSKVESGRMELEPAPFMLEEALQNGISMLRERALRREISMSLHIEPGLDVIDADERKVKQVVFNLLSNAVKFTPAGGSVDVFATRDGDDVTIAVQDTGVGIAPHEQALVFEEFRQATRKPGTDAEGTGLGLALARKLIALHGGTISLTSALGEGSTFSFILPGAALNSPETTWARPGGGSVEKPRAMAIREG